MYIDKTIAILKKALKSSWSDETVNERFAGCPPPEGQCDVTSLVVQDFLGGKIKRLDFSNYFSKDEVLHYFNVVSDGTKNKVVDLTLNRGPPLDESFGKEIERKYMFHIKTIKKRYEILRENVYNFFKEKRLTLWAYYFICEKTGYNKALALDLYL
ncbi:MAG: hypothetical protein DRO96_02715 [Candidatus Aenigmatarchaeota archaeon]|nr:MAG: hypothetical protein DRO96_02715 [Candidatus Aenigmarchaeota archaeon]